MNLTHVLTPIKIGGLEIKNRVVRTAHTTIIGGGIVNEDLIAYHEARARGGVGLSVIEAMSVHPSSLATLNVFDPRVGQGYPALVDRLRPHGMKVFQQLFHGGHHSNPADGGPPWSASDIPGHANGAPPIPMTQAMIDAVVEGYAGAARRSIEWGADGVEVHCAHGFLIQQFLSTYANDRTDDYGGSFENRARFMMDVMRAVRASVPAGTVVGIRLAPDLMVGGVGVEDNRRAAEMVVGEALVDYVSISSGTFQTFPKMIGGMHEPAGFELPTSTPISVGIGVPTIVIGRFRTLEEADQSIRAGEADMVGMVRATIADPDLVRKTIAGHPEQVRPCIACNQGCIAQVLGAERKMGCAVNAAVGLETKIGDDRIVAAETPGKVLVIGGGPAGMEAARIAALRGHRVVLAEAASSLGGAINLASMAPSRSGIRDITVWMEQEIYRLGVDVRLSTYMEAEEVIAEGADHVIVAAGSLPRMDGVQLSNPGEPVVGIEAPHVLSSNELFLDPNRDPGRTAVVIDDTGHYEAVAAAEYLMSKGASVTFLTRHTAFAPGIENALMVEPALQRMSRGELDIRVRTRAIAVEADGVLIGPVFLARDSNMVEKVPANTVVFVSPNRPNRGMVDELRAAGMNVSVVGDANTPRFLPVAIREGNAAGRAL